MNLLRNGPRKATMFDLSLKKKVLFFSCCILKRVQSYELLSIEFSDSVGQSSHFCNARINFKKSLFYASLQKSDEW